MNCKEKNINLKLKEYALIVLYIAVLQSFFNLKRTPKIYIYISDTTEFILFRVIWIQQTNSKVID